MNRPLVAILALSLASTTPTCASQVWLGPPSRSSVSGRPSPTINVSSHRSTRCSGHDALDDAPYSSSTLLSIRGGSSLTQDDNDNEGKEDAEVRKKQLQQEQSKLLKYRTEQQLLYQLRSTYLSEMLASRGVPVPTVLGVATAEGNKVPEMVDWDCAMCTYDEPKVSVLLRCDATVRRSLFPLSYLQLHSFTLPQWSPLFTHKTNNALLPELSLLL